MSTPDVKTLQKQLAETQSELEKVLVEKHFLEEATRHLNFLHNTHDGVFFTNAKDEVTFINPYMTGMLGVEDVDQLVGQALPDRFWDDPNDKQQLLQDLREQGFVRERILTLRKADGAPVYVSCSAVSVLDRAEKYVGAEVMLCNITSKRNLEAQRSDELDAIREHAATLSSRLNDGDVEAAKAEVDALLKVLGGTK